jgi:hypothetical protein
MCQTYDALRFFARNKRPTWPRSIFFQGIILLNIKEIFLFYLVCPVGHLPKCLELIVHLPEGLSTDIKTF